MMKDHLNNTAVLIPSLEPDDKLVPYLKELLAEGLQVLVVDDGSSEKYQPIFKEAESLEGCWVTHHEVNKGKGEALKTGYRFIKASEAFKGCQQIVTADADGQHILPDVLNVAKAASEKPASLILGSRDFSLPQVPPKSRFGNRTTSFVFWLLYSQWLPDTQTGLRGFGRELLDFMIDVEGSRFEYEMNVLIACSRQKVPMEVVTIETVYHNENSGTHFHPIRDSIKIYKVILKNFFKFMSSSFIGTGIDLILCFILFDVLRNAGLEPESLRITAATVIARVVSASVNFMLNKNFVFKLKNHGSRALVRYIILCICIAAMSSTGVTLLHAGLSMSDKIAKVICDTLLFFLSYRAQRSWVFDDKDARKETSA
ncbi:MAG: bifunctional glycosyltransferase family 2/GtrA family protein [Clostridia bacterium]|nr:bifunctional glycosyltransferase family 2/GtrA family protein [Clostridia bacterium]